MPRVGCPITGITEQDFEKGIRFFDTEDSGADNQYSSDIARYLAGVFLCLNVINKQIILAEIANND